MKLYKITYMLMALALWSCAENEADVEIDDDNFPLRLQIAEEGADLADAEDYGVEISFADYLGELPASDIVLSYTLSGEGDFMDVSIDEIIYEYEEGDCVFEREITFTESTMTIPVDPDMGTVPEEFEIVVAFNLSGEEASDGGFQLEITAVQSADHVVFNDITTFEYEILDNDAAGEWVLELNEETDFNQFKEVFGPLSTDLQAISFGEITGEVIFGFEFEEMKIEIELVEEEEVSECEDGEVATEMENLVVEIEAEYEAEEGEIAFEESYYNEDGEELDFIVESAYQLEEEAMTLTFTKVIDEDHFEEGDELFNGENSFLLIKD